MRLILIPFHRLCVLVRTPVANETRELVCERRSQPSHVVVCACVATCTLDVTCIKATFGPYTYSQLFCQPMGVVLQARFGTSAGAAPLHGIASVNDAP